MANEQETEAEVTEAVVTENDAPENPGFSREVLAQLFEAAKGNVQGEIEKIRAKLKDSIKADRNVRLELEGALDILDEIPNQIARAPEVIRTRKELEAVCGRINSLIKRAKQKLLYNYTKYLSQEIQREYSAAIDAVEEQMSAVESERSDPAAIVNEGESIATETVAVPVESAATEDSVVTEEVSSESESEGIGAAEGDDGEDDDSEEYGESLSSLLRDAGEDSVEQQKEFIKKKLKGRFGTHYMEFLELMTIEPHKFGKKISKSQAERFYEAANHYAVKIDELVDRCPVHLLPYQRAFAELREDEEYKNVMEQLNEEVITEFEQSVLVPFCQSIEEMETNEDLALYLWESQTDQSIEGSDDVALVMHWGKIEAGKDSPPTETEMIVLRTRIKTKKRNLRGLKKNDDRLDEVAVQLNNSVYGGYQFREREFVRKIIRSFLGEITVRTDEEIAAQPPEEEVSPEAHSATVVTESDEPVTDADAVSVTDGYETETDEDADSTEETVDSAPAAVAPVVARDPIEEVVNEDSEHKSKVIEKEVEDKEVDAAVAILEHMSVSNVADIPKKTRKSLWAQISLDAHSKLLRVSADFQREVLRRALEKIKALAMGTAAPVSAEAHVPSDEPTSREKMLVKQMFRADLSRKTRIDVSRAKDLLVQINIARMKKKLPPRDLAFAEALIESMQPVSEEDAVLTAAPAVEVTEVDPVQSVVVVADMNDDATVIVPTDEQTSGTTDATPTQTAIIDVNVGENPSQTTASQETEVAIVQSSEADESKIPSRLAAFAKQLEHKTQTAVRQAREALTKASETLRQVREGIVPLQQQATQIGHDLHEILPKVTDDTTRALINTAQLKKSDLTATGILQETHASLVATVENFDEVRRIQTLRTKLNDEVDHLLKAHQKAKEECQRAIAFKREAAREIFGMRPADLLEDDDLSILAEVDEFNALHLHAKQDIQEVVTLHLQETSTQLDEFTLSSMGINELYDLFAKARDRLAGYLEPASAGSTEAVEDLRDIELEPVQLHLLQILTAQTGKRHPRNDTWGRTSSKLSEFYAVTFQNGRLDEEEIETALEDAQLTTGKVERDFGTERPKRADLTELRQAETPLVIWKLHDRKMYLPTYVGFKLMEKYQPSMDGEALRRLIKLVRPDDTTKKKKKKKS